MLHATPVHKGGAFYHRGILLRTAVHEVRSAFELKNHDSTTGSMDSRHSRFGLVEIGHAINPRVHVPTVELRKAEAFQERIMEGGPVANCRSVDGHRHKFHSSHPSANAAAQHKQSYSIDALRVRKLIPYEAFLYFSIPRP